MLRGCPTCPKFHKYTLSEDAVFCHVSITALHRWTIFVFPSLRITLSVIKTHENPVQGLLGDSSEFRHICWDTRIGIQRKLLSGYRFEHLWRFSGGTAHRGPQRQTLPVSTSAGISLFMGTGASGSFWKLLHRISFLIGNFLDAQWNLPQTPPPRLERAHHTDIRPHTQGPRPAAVPLSKATRHTQPKGTERSTCGTESEHTAPPRACRLQAWPEGPGCTNLRAAARRLESTLQRSP